MTAALALTAGGTVEANHMPPVPKLDKLSHLRGSLNTIRRNKCLAPRRYRWTLWQVPVHMRSYVNRQTAEVFIPAARAANSRCETAAAWAWHYGSAATCVRSKEGGLTSVNPAGPYYGWYQTDPSFQAAYGPEFYRAYGPGIWPATAQVLTAFRGYRARGWQPWPTTARACGLI